MIHCMWFWSITLCEKFWAFLSFMGAAPPVPTFCDTMVISSIFYDIIMYFWENMAKSLAISRRIFNIRCNNFNEESNKIIENLEWGNLHIRERNYRRMGQEIMEELRNISVYKYFTIVEENFWFNLNRTKMHQNLNFCTV